MGRGWRPIVVASAVSVGVFALAQAKVFAPTVTASTVAGGDVYRGETVFQRDCSSCHGMAGAGGGVGPKLAGAKLTAAAVASRVEQGGGVMPAGLVSGKDEADVVAYVVSISGTSG
jgi:mono/diheme cytochrome c family protein